MSPSDVLETVPILTDPTYWAGCGSGAVVIVILRLIWRMFGKKAAEPAPEVVPPPEPPPTVPPPPELVDNWETNPASQDDRRRQLRRTGNVTPVRVLGTDGDKVLHCHVLDRSRGGLRLAVPKVVHVATA